MKPNTNSLITIEVLDEEPHEDPFQYLLRCAGTIDGPEDWAPEHDHYLYGTPKNWK